MKYWIFQNNQVLGPYEPDEMGKISVFSPESLVCPEGRRGTSMGDWQRAGMVPDLSVALLRASSRGGKTAVLSIAGLPPEPTLKDLVQLGSIQEKVATLEEVVLQLQEGLRAKDAELSSVHQELAGKSREATEIKDEAAARQRESDELKRQISGLEDRLSSVRLLSETLDKAVEEEKRVEHDVEKQGHELSELAVAVEDLRKQLEESRALEVKAAIADPSSLLPPIAFPSIAARALPTFDPSRAFTPGPVTLAGPGVELSPEVASAPVEAEAANARPSSLLPMGASVPIPSPLPPMAAESAAVTPLIPIPESFSSPADFPSIGARALPAFDSSMAFTPEPVALADPGVQLSPEVASAPVEAKAYGVIAPPPPAKGKKALLFGAVLGIAALGVLAVTGGFVPGLRKPQAPASVLEPKPLPPPQPPAPPPPDPRQTAVDLAKSWALPRDRTLGGVLEELAPSSGNLSPWMAETLADDRVQVNYFARSTAPDAPTIAYEFEVGLASKTLVGRNAAAKSVLTGKAAAPPAPPKPKPVKVKPKPVPKAPAEDTLDSLLGDAPAKPPTKAAPAPDAQKARARAKPARRAAKAKARAAKPADENLLDDLLQE